MPVYLATVHAYRSWTEDHPKGYVQRDGGLMPPSKGLEIWRGEQAIDEEARFELPIQELLHTVTVEIARERLVSLHACATCPTHLHGLVSFRIPACTCGARKWCKPTCTARTNVDRFVVRLKRKLGQAIAKHEGTCGRKWLSRGWDIAAVRNRDHFDYLVTEYLPDHERSQVGIFRRYGS